MSLNVAVAAHWNATVLLFQTRIDRIGARVIGFFPVPLWCHFGWASEEARIDLPHHPVVLWWSCSWTEERRLLLTTASHECNVFVLASKNTYPLSHTHIQDTDNDWQSTLLGRVKYGQHNHLWAVLGFVFACCITVYRWTFSGPSHYMLHGGGGIGGGIALNDPVKGKGKFSLHRRQTMGQATKEKKILWKKGVSIKCAAAFGHMQPFWGVLGPKKGAFSVAYPSTAGRRETNIYHA